MFHAIRAAVLLSILSAATVLQGVETASDAGAADTPLYHELVLADGPAAYWRMDVETSGEAPTIIVAGGSGEISGSVVGAVDLKRAGPRPKMHPAFSEKNSALQFHGRRGFIRVSDPGEDSPLDFDVGDSITLEAWVDVRELREGQQIYIVGKGRTTNKGFERDNQNYALRLRGMGGTARVSFLFRRRASGKDKPAEFHRFNSRAGFPVGGGWHHVAVTYTFGQGDSIRAYIDGAEVQGDWDMGGPTNDGPVVDDDELWIGSSMGGNPGSTFNGLIDEVAIYRHAVPPNRIKQRYRALPPDPDAFVAALEDLPDDAVTVNIFEGVADRTWELRLSEPTGSYTEPAFGLVHTLNKYTPQALIADRSNPFLVRVQGKRSLPAGAYQFLLSAKSAARLYIDGRLVASTGFMSRNASGHEAVPELAQPQFGDLRPPPPGHQEQLASVELEAGVHHFRVDTIVGGKGLRAELGELSVGLAIAGQQFVLLAPDAGDAPLLTDKGWREYTARARAQIARRNALARRAIGRHEADYWLRRHQRARESLAEREPIEPPECPPNLPVRNDIDRFIGRRLAEAGARPAPLTDDASFLRRVTLDIVGRLPTRGEISDFEADENPSRRSRAIDRLLDDPRWADNWVGYWQDVLAENPGILKPKLNNTGPFRWWIYESFYDNKPLDRFVTELVMMQGSKYGGAPGGFGMASQNDVPMAAKAHVVAKAFLGLDMTCARCHDAPYHPFKQEELFNLAAMLDKKTIALPKSSTVPVEPGGRQPLVTISLKPGQKIDPAWPFAELAPGETPSDLLRGRDDPRERLAAIITSPQNDRFAQVAVNRLWKRYLGAGLVEPVDDWNETEPSHPQLLDWLARQFVASGYDSKHAARLILNSHAYQRQVDADLIGGASPRERLFASPMRRRMTAEQIIDSLFSAAGKPMRSEPLTLDPEGRRPEDTFLNLGSPRAAWEFTSLSNERDRPALALPVAQSVVDVLLTFGWRDSRPNPLTERDETPTALQPLMLANGIVANRVTQLSDDNAITRMCLEEQPVEQLVDDVFLQFLSRRPTERERGPLIELLSDGYAERVVPAADVPPPVKKTRRNAVSWSNHLSAEATKIKLELERAARQGDPPTGRLRADWRERMEDVVWALINSPEFIFLP